MFVSVRLSSTLLAALSCEKSCVRFIKAHCWHACCEYRFKRLRSAAETLLTRSWALREIFVLVNKLALSLSACKGLVFSCQLSETAQSNLEDKVSTTLVCSAAKTANKIVVSIFCCSVI